MGPVVLGANATTAEPTTAPTPPTLRTFAHCSKRFPGAVAFAVAVSPCIRTEALVIRFADALTLTTYVPKNTAYLEPHLFLTILR